MRTLKMVFINNLPWIGGKLGSQYFHGDSIYMAMPDGTDVLLDAGTEISGPHIAKKLADMGVTKLDHFILSHQHTDHANGLEAVADALPVGEIIASGYGMNNLTAAPSLPRVLEKHGMPLRELRRGTGFELGGARFEVFHPAANAQEAKEDAPECIQGEAMNNNSLVLRLSYGAFSALLPGDIHLSTEESLIELFGASLESTLLKVPHHGNDTSMGKAFLDCVSPAFGISLGRACSGLIWRKFAAFGAPLYATYTDGDIIVETDGEWLRVSSDKGTREYPLK